MTVAIEHCCPDCDVPMGQLLFMGCIPDGYVCPNCDTLFSEDGRALAHVIGG